MRVMHTSDWHLGRTFHGQNLLDDQRAVLGALADLVREHGVDVVVVAGDLYDRAIPSAEATRVATEAVTRIRSAGAELIAISGNHDSAPRLGAFADVLASGGFHLRTDPSRVAEPVIVSDADGPVAIYAIPYLEPEVVRATLGIEGPAGHQQVLGAAMDRIRADLAGRTAGTRAVVTAHAFVGGGAASESERSIAVGGVEAVSPDVFDGVDYVALGHLHGRQRLADRLRYSGSILPYSFGESVQRKGVWIVDLPESAGAAAPTVHWQSLPVVRPLATIAGELAELLADHADLTDHYLAVRLTDRVRPIDPMRRLQEKFPHVVTLSWEPDGAAREGPVLPDVTAATPDEEVIAQFVTDCRRSAPTDSERALIESVVAAERSKQVTA